MTTRYTEDDAAALVALVVQYSTRSEGPPVQVDRAMLEGFVRHAMRHHYARGKRERCADRVREATQPKAIAEILRTYASKYDHREWHDEACLLRDAATELEAAAEVLERDDT